MTPTAIRSCEVRGMGHLISYDVYGRATVHEADLREYENNRPRTVERMKEGVYYDSVERSRIYAEVKRSAEAELRLMIAGVGRILGKNILKGLLSDGVDINLQGKSGYTVLHKAIERDKYAIIEFLMQKGADINIRDDWGRTPLSMEVNKGLECDKTMVELLLNRGAHVNVKDIGSEFGGSFKVTLLSLAVCKCRMEIVEMLFMHGADVNLINDTCNLIGHRLNYNLLHELMKCGGRVADKINKVKVLLKRGIFVNAKTCYGETVLHMAAEKFESEIVRELLEKGGDVNAQDDPGQTPLHRAITIMAPLHRAITIMAPHMAASKDQIEIVRQLIDKGADVDAKDGNGRTALDIAEEYNQKNVINVLINARDAKGRTILHRAAISGSVNDVEALIQKGVDIHILDNEGLTPLKWALAKEHVQVAGKLLKADKTGPSALIKAVRLSDFRIVKYLLQDGIDEDLRDEDCSTALYEAILKGREDIIELLFDCCTNLDRLSDVWCLFHDTVESGKQKIVGLFLKKGIDINVRDKDGRTALHKAVLGESIVRANMLLAHGADVNIKDKNNHTALHIAASRNVPELVTLLIENGAEIREKDDDGHTPLYLAVQNGDELVVWQLVLQGASIHDIDKDGMSLLCLAAENGYLQIVKMLLEKGVDVKTKDREGYTSLHRAAMKGDKDIVEFLITNGADTNAKDSEGKTPFHRAALAGAKEVIEFFIALQDNKEKVDETECVICLEHVGEKHVADPCGHANICAYCRPRVQRCPMCRKRITKWIKLFE